MPKRGILHNTCSKICLIENVFPLIPTLNLTLTLTLTLNLILTLTLTLTLKHNTLFLRTIL